MRDPRREDQARSAERQQLGAVLESNDHHLVSWRTKWRLEKREGDWTPEQIAAGLAPAPYEVIEGEGNMLVYAGISNLWECLKGNGTGTGGNNLTFFDNTNAKLGVGDGTASEAATQTDLQGTNKTRKAMDATYPTHTDGTTVSSNVITFQSTYATGEANHGWKEWGIFNAASGGRMLNRKQVDLGTKASGTWALQVTITLS